MAGAADGSEERLGLPQQDSSLASPGLGHCQHRGHPPGMAVLTLCCLQGAASLAGSLAPLGPVPSPRSPAVSLTCPLSSLPTCSLAGAPATRRAGKGWGLCGCASVAARCPLQHSSGSGHGGTGAGLSGEGRAMAPSCPTDARNPVLALRTQSSSQSLGSSAGHGEETREAPSPFPGKGKRDGEPAWLQPLGTGDPRHGTAA